MFPDLYRQSRMQASLEFSSMTVIVDAEENYPYYVNPVGPQYVIKTYY